MSTPGKVLVVLVLLITPVWVMMVSGVAQLNKNWGKQVDDLKKQVKTLEDDVVAMRKSVVDLKDTISLEQVTMADEIAALRSHAADLQKTRTDALEYASRAQLQRAATEEQAKAAESTRDLRVTEHKEEIAAKAAAEAEVENLKQEHATLTEQLDKLRDDFKKTVESNRRLVARLKGRRSS
jgi:cell division protein FtsB